jgi:ketosteroid isomerase-like protein
VPPPALVRQAIASYAAAVSSADKEAILACYSDDTQVTDPYPGPTHEGREGASRFWDGVLQMGTPVSFVADRVVVAGDRGVFSFTIQIDIGEGEGKARLQVEGYDVLTIDDDGQIAEQLAYWDPASMHPVAAPTDGAAEPESGSEPESEEVAAVAARMCAAFGRHDKAAYFRLFAPEATFLFYDVDHMLESRSAYEELWARWESEDGFRVLSCSSEGGRTQSFGDVALFTHNVTTSIASRSGTVTLAERETIVFRSTGDSWLAVHEHVSLPAAEDLLAK